jgi:hypothetical protein
MSERKTDSGAFPLAGEGCARKEAGPFRDGGERKLAGLSTDLQKDGKIAISDTVSLNAALGGPEYGSSFLHPQTRGTGWLGDRKVQTRAIAISTQHRSPQCRFHIHARNSRDYDD